jgi:hypothetical protein
VPEYETKDSGERAQFASGMQRDTQAGKPRFDLILPEGIPYEAQLLTRFAALMERGAAKYTERNWEKANSKEEVDRMKASGLRHFMQWYHGEVDEDHAAAVLFNIMAASATQWKIDHASNALETVEVKAWGEPPEPTVITGNPAIDYLDYLDFHNKALTADGGLH